MNMIPTSPPSPDHVRLDDVQWQRANNEGWPERGLASAEAPPGAIAPVIALVASDNVVDMHAWRVRRDPVRRGTNGG